MTNVLRKKWIKRIESISVYEERLLFTLNASLLHQCIESNNYTRDENTLWSRGLHDDDVFPSNKSIDIFR
jgi:hypothetical protein